MTVLQCLDRQPLGRVNDEALLDGLLVGAQGGIDSHGQDRNMKRVTQYASSIRRAISAPMLPACRELPDEPGVYALLYRQPAISREDSAMRKLLGLGLLLLTLSACALFSNRDPLNISVVGIEPLPSQDMEVRFAVTLRVQNPNETAIAWR